MFLEEQAADPQAQLGLVNLVTWQTKQRDAVNVKPDVAALKLDQDWKADGQNINSLETKV